MLGDGKTLPAYGDTVLVLIGLPSITPQAPPETFTRYGIPAAPAYELMAMMREKHGSPGPYSLIFHGRFRALSWRSGNA